VRRKTSLIAAALFATSSILAGQTRPWIDVSGHTESLVSVGTGVKVEVLDWGGTGPPLVLLTGLGNTAHVFDHFAHQFTDRFHVLGVTRRGYGASSHPTAGYDIATRANDILAISDHFKFDRILLVGHSIAGDELTRLAATFPTRVLALVYLDAAYDRTQVKQLPQPSYPQPTADTYTSAEKYMAYLARVWNWRAPEAELYNTRSVRSDGYVGDMKTGPEITSQIISRIEAPDYRRVRAPALALYSRPDLRTVYPYYAEFDAESKARADRIIDETGSYQQRSIAGFRAGANNRETVVLDGNHYMFFTNEAEVVRLMRDFLSKSVLHEP